VIKSMNISYETFINDKSGDIKVGNVSYKKEKGIMPSIIDSLLEISGNYKKLRNEAKLGTDDYTKYANLYEVSKFIILSFYGTQAQSQYRLFNIENASSITRVGREIIQYSRDIIEKEGHKSVLTDTDSVFVHLKHHNNTKEECLEEGQRIEKLLNKKYDDFVKQYGIEKHFFIIELEKIFSKLLIGAKKRYCGKVIYTG